MALAEKVPTNANVFVTVMLKADDVWAVVVSAPSVTWMVKFACEHGADGVPAIWPVVGENDNPGQRLASDGTAVPDCSSVKVEVPIRLAIVGVVVVVGTLTSPEMVEDGPPEIESGGMTVAVNAAAELE